MFTQTELEKIKRYINGVSDKTDSEWIESMLMYGEENKELRHLIETDWNQTHDKNSSSDIK